MPTLIPRALMLGIAQSGGRQAVRRELGRWKRLELEALRLMPALWNVALASPFRAPSWSAHL